MNREKLRRSVFFLEHQLLNLNDRIDALNRTIHGRGNKSGKRRRWLNRIRNHYVAQRSKVKKELRHRKSLIRQFI